MRIMKQKGLAAILVIAAVLCAGAAPAASRADVIRRLDEFRQFFIDFQQAPDSAIPGDLLAECHGVIIMRQYKAGFVFGVRGGDGVILLHDRATRTWSPPAFVISAEGSFGFQIGGQAIDAIMLIMNRDGVDMLLKTRFKIGVDASAAAGPVGRDASAKVGPGTAILAYSRSKGLYAGMSFEGGALLNYNEYNRLLYGMDVSLKNILFDHMVATPPEAYPIIETLQAYADAQPAYTLQPAPSPQPSQPTPPAQPAASGPIVLQAAPPPSIFINPPAPVVSSREEEERRAAEAAAQARIAAAAAAEAQARAAETEAAAAAGRAAQARAEAERAARAAAGQ